MTVIEACTPAARFRVIWSPDLDAELESAREALSTFPLTEGREPPVVFRVDRYEGEGRELFTVHEPEGGVRHCLDVNQVTSILVGRLNRLHLDEASDLVNLHAAGLSLDGQGVVLVGPSGSGKSTLALAAVVAGFDYLSDETVGIDATGRMRWYPKPITAKSGSWSLVASITASAPPLVDRSSGRRWEIPVNTLRPDAATALADPVLVLRVTHAPGADPAHRPLDAIAALDLLVENSSDLERAGADGLGRLARLAARATAGDLNYSDASEAVPVVEALLADPRPDLDVEDLGAQGGGRVLPPGELTPGARPARLTPSVVIGGRAVVHRPRFDRLFALDPVATLAWRLLDGRASVTGIAAAVGEEAGVPTGAVRQLLDELARLGLLGEAATGEVAP